MSLSDEQKERVMQYQMKKNQRKELRRGLTKTTSLLMIQQQRKRKMKKLPKILLAKQRNGPKELQRRRPQQQPQLSMEWRKLQWTSMMRRLSITAKLILSSTENDMMVRREVKGKISLSIRIRRAKMLRKVWGGCKRRELGKAIPSKAEGRYYDL